MAELVYAVLCQRVIIDQATNFVSYIDVLDGVSVPKLPYAVPPTMIGTIWQVSNENRLEMRVRVVGPDGHELADAIANPLDLKPSHQRGRMNVRVPGYEAASCGTYLVEIDLLTNGVWKQRSQLPLQISLTESVATLETALPATARKAAPRAR